MMKAIIASTATGTTPEKTIRNYFNEAGIVPAFLIPLEPNAP